jgi:hypothetical protein
MLIFIFDDKAKRASVLPGLSGDLSVFAGKNFNLQHVVFLFSGNPCRLYFFLYKWVFFPVKLTDLQLSRTKPAPGCLNPGGKPVLPGAGWIPTLVGMTKSKGDFVK